MKQQRANTTTVSACRLHTERTVQSEVVYSEDKSFVNYLRPAHCDGRMMDDDLRPLTFPSPDTDCVLLSGVNGV